MNIQNQLWPRTDADPPHLPDPQATIPSVTLGGSRPSFFHREVDGVALPRASYGSRDSHVKARKDPGVWVDVTLIHPRAIQLLALAGLSTTEKWWRD